MKPTLATRLAEAVAGGIQAIGQVAIVTDVPGTSYLLCHIDDIDAARGDDFGGLTRHTTPEAGRDISIHSEDGDYRFTKGRTDLRRGWVITLENAGDLRLAIEHIYPAAVGLWLAMSDGTLAVENLRDKLGRQTGMYRYARTISDAGAQQLVRKVCGPAHACAKRILWKIDAATPLDDSEASRYDGIPAMVPADRAIPLLCREACNHFVAECRKAAKAEFEAQAAAAD